MAADPGRQIASLGRQIAALEGRLGELTGELVELSAQLGPFLERYQREILDYHNELVQLQRQIADRHLLRGERKASGPGRADTPLSRLVENEGYLPVQEQYERVWGGKRPLRPKDVLDDIGLPPPPDDVRALYAEIVARLHPDLAESEGERRRRQGLMEGVNRAYLKRDRTSLQAIAEAQRDHRSLPAVVDEEMLAGMRKRAAMLEEVIMALEGRLFELRHGDAARVMALAVQARLQGIDLLSELSQALKQEIAEAKEQLARL